MIQIQIIAVGTLSENFYKEGIAEYVKRCSAYSKISITELKDEKIPVNASPNTCSQIIQREGKLISAAIQKGSYVIALDVGGKRISSEGLADKIISISNGGISRITFVIGGSLGISRDVVKESDMSISLSDMTFTHQMARLVLTEQIYRAFTIINNKPYHR